MCPLAAWVLSTAALGQNQALPPVDASSFPDIEEPEPGPSPPEVYPLPTWGEDDAKVIARLWPGNPGSPSNLPKVFVPEIQLPPEVDPSVIPDVFLADYFGQLPETQLVDPQTLLTAHERTSVNNALIGHLNTQQVPVYILLFQKEQQFPKFQSLEGLQSKWFGANPGIVIAFWLGSPTRTSANFGYALRQDYGDQLDQAFADALGQSYTKTYPYSQLDHFTYTLLWRLSHLEKGAFNGNGQAAIPTPLAIPDFSDHKDESWVPIAAGGSALALGVAALGAGVIVSLRKRERKQKVVQPVSLTFQPAAERLEAPFSGGSGAAVKVTEQAQNSLP